MLNKCYIFIVVQVQLPPLNFRCYCYHELHGGTSNGPTPDKSMLFRAGGPRLKKEDRASFVFLKNIFQGKENPIDG